MKDRGDAMTLTTLHEERLILGEGPVWDSRTDRLIWVDILAGAILNGGARGQPVKRTVLGEHVWLRRLDRRP